VTTRRLAVSAAVAGAILVAAYVSLFLPGAYFRFDDFHQITESASAFVDLRAILTTTNEADGRWNPGMRLALRGVAAVGGLDRAWPFYAALLIGHALNILLIVRIASALGASRRVQAATAFIAIAGLNFSLFTLVTIALLFSVLCTAWMLAAVLAAVRYARGGGGWYAAACIGCTVAALCFREIAVVTPLLSALVLVVAGVGAAPRLDMRRWLGLGAAFAAAAVIFFALATLAGATLVPDSGRYQFSLGLHTARHIVVLGAHVAVWIAVPLLARRRVALRVFRDDLALAAGWAILSVLPTLLLTWQSPGHLYLALFGTALAGGRMWASLDERSAPAAFGLPLVAALVCIGAAGVVTQRQILAWGPMTRQILTDWQSLRRPADERVIIFDADNDAPYHGVVRLIGPGIRLREALTLFSRARVARASICIDVIVGPPYVAEPGDALFVNDNARLHRVDAPPFKAYCLP
jgi:hypothetical protein